MDYAKGQRQPKTDRTTEKVWKDILKMLLDFGFRAAKKREREMLEHEGIDKYDRIYVRDINLWNKNGHSLTVRPSFNKTQTKCTDSKNEVHVDPNKIRDTCINSINILLRAVGRNFIQTLIAYIRCLWHLVCLLVYKYHMIKITTAVASGILTNYLDIKLKHISIGKIE